MRITESKLRRIIRQVIKENMAPALTCEDVRDIVSDSLRGVSELSEFCHVLAMSMSGCGLSKEDVEMLVERMLGMAPGRGVDYLSRDEMRLQRSYLSELSSRREELVDALCRHCGIQQ